MTDSKWVPVRDKILDMVSYGAKYFFPILATIAPVVGLPSWVGVVAGAIVPQLMSVAEQNNPAPGSGPMKKAQVMDATKKILDILNNTFTGQAKANYDSIMPTISKLIDQTVAAVNELMPEVIADDAPPLPLSGMDTSGVKAPVDSP